jgi:hypothetical protein
MRYVALTLLLLMAATPLAASWYPRWSTTDLTMAIGDRVVVRVTPTWSGLVDYGNGVHWTFGTDNTSVATGEVRLDSTSPKDFTLTAVGLGFAHIRNPGGYPYVTIRVICGDERPAIAAQPVVGVELGHAARLTIVTEYENRSTFRWYLGKIGDTSHPLDRNSADAIYTPAMTGTCYLWAEATTACSTSQVQFRVDAYVPRRRSVSH